MSEIEQAVLHIKEALKAGVDTSESDWKIIFSSLEGDTDLSTISKVRGFIEEKFSFALEEGADAYAYFGSSGTSIVSSTDAQIYKYLEVLSKDNKGVYGYISSTEAGKLFNDYHYIGV